MLNSLSFRNNGLFCNDTHSDQEARDGRTGECVKPFLVSLCKYVNKSERINTSQVLVLELETRLQKERERLGELRKKHYELAGVAEGWGGEEEGKTSSKTTNICLSATQYSLTISQNRFLLKNHCRVP